MHCLDMLHPISNMSMEYGQVPANGLPRVQGLMIEKVVEFLSAK